MTQKSSYKLPDSIRLDGERFFGSSLLQTAIRYLQESKVSISFKKGGPLSYFIVSGIIRDNRTHESKVVYKKRLEGTNEGPLSSNCDCHHWNDQKHCAHVAALFCSYHLQNFMEANHLQHEENHEETPPLLLNSSLAVNVHEYGTIIAGPHQFAGATSAQTYSALNYLLHNKKTIPFPLPENFRGRLQIFLSQEKSMRFKWVNPHDTIFSEISFFENLYLFNWKSGEVFHLSSALKMFIQRVRLNQFSYSINDILLNLQELELFENVDIFIDNIRLTDQKVFSPKMRLTITPSEKSGLLKVSFECFNENDLFVRPPEIFGALNYSNGILSHFKKKQDAYEFIDQLAESFLSQSDSYKKNIVSSSKKTKLIQIMNEMQNNNNILQYDEMTKELTAYDSHIVKEIFLAIVEHFTSQFFRTISINSETAQLQYDLQPTTVFQGLSEFYKRTTIFGLEIFYDRTEISKWNSRVRFERRSSDTKWFDLELNIDLDDLMIIKEADLETGIAITKNGLILLTKEQKDMIRFMQKYTKYEATDEKTEIDGSKTIKKFILPFNRARVFELFELKKLGIEGALTTEDIQLCEKLSNLTEMPSYPLPDTLNAILRPYQKTGFDWLSFLYEHKLGACLADDMGLGKTLQAIAFLESIYGKIKKALIVCPVSILLNWENEIKKFSQMELAIYHGGSREFPNDKKIILTSYGVMKKESEAVFASIDFDILILDEVQHLKNIRSLGAFSARKIKADFRICLTGTPVENDLSEFYNILDLSIPGIWGDLQFVRAISNSKTRMIAKKTAAPFILRRTKAQVLHDLPAKIENNILLEMKEGERAFYQQNLLGIKAKIQSSQSTAKYGEILRGLLTLRQNCLWQNRTGEHQYTQLESSKIEFLLETLESILEEGHQAIVFSQFTTYLDIIQTFFKEKHWKYSRIDGSQNINKRQAEVDQFQSGKTPIFLISLRAGGVGLNLTAASYVFIMDPWWNPAVESQAIDRAHRIGQKNTLTVYRPIMKNSVEEKVLKLQEEKKQLFQDLLSSDDEQLFTGRLTMKDFEMLFNDE